MSMDRRKFLGIAAAGVASASINLEGMMEKQQGGRAIHAIGFDGFVIFDYRAIGKRVEEVVPEKAAEFSSLWRMRQFEYTWLRTAGRQYRDFWKVTEDALLFTATSMKLSLTGEQRDRLMSVYRELPVWPDVKDALTQFRRRGIKLAFLSNLTAEMLDANVAKNGLQEFFEPHLSTDRVQEYKPSPRAYQMGVDAFGLKREQIAFAAFGGWDAAGAKWFGYPTVWVNRASATVEELGVKPDAVSTDIGALVKLVGS